MTKRIDVAVFIAISSDGEYVVAADPDLAIDAYANEIGGAAVFTVREITLSVPLPAVSVPGGRLEVSEPAPEAVTKA